VALLLSGSDGGEHWSFLERSIGEQAVLEVPRVDACTANSRGDVKTRDRDPIGVVAHEAQ
jgi:hypothetical protein